MEPAVEDCYDDGAMAAQYLTPLTHDIISKTILKVETRNDQLGRTLRVTQKKLNVVGGNNIQTRIEVIDDYLPSAPVMFSVKHTHGTPWARQMIVHKNLFLACILTGVTDPPLEVCKDAQQMFENSENVAHMHSYMERALPRIRQVVFAAFRNLSVFTSTFIDYVLEFVQLVIYWRVATMAAI